MEQLIAFGLMTGFISGFFGVGGGTILVPLLMFNGFTIKEAVGISVIQMFFSSSYGSYLNYRKKMLDTSIVITIALGGLVGAFTNAYWVPYVSETFLEYLFLLFALLATIKLFVATPEATKLREVPKWQLLLFGVFLGSFAIAVGVGGAILLTPFLVSYVGLDVKRAVSASLFFVLFSSSAAMVSWSMQGLLLFDEGLVIGLSSMVGVYISMYLNDKVSSTWHKRLLVMLNVIILSFITIRIAT